MNRPVYKSASTKSVITTGFAAIFLLMIAVVWLSLATLQSVNTRMANLVQGVSSKSSTTFQMRDLIRQRANAVVLLQLVTAPAERAEISDDLMQVTNAYNVHRLRLSEQGIEERERQLLEKIASTDSRINEVYNRVHALVHSPVNQKDKLHAAIQETQLQEFVLLNHLNDLVNLEKELATEELHKNQQRYLEIRKSLTLIALVSFALGLLISVVVISRVGRANARIAHLASHDDLTALINRREFEQRLQKTIITAQNNKHVYGLMYVDLDRFKIINDTCGHQAGDRLLIEITALMRRLLPRNDVLARIGGDEFAIITRADDFSQITALAESLRQRVSAYVFNYDNQKFKVSLSIGVTVINGQVVDLESLLRNVDSACYVSKKGGRNRVHIASQNDQEVVKYRNDIAGIKTLREALIDERLTLFYQPVFNIKGSKPKMEHCEILLRLRCPQGNLYSPAEFIPLAEKYNIMSDIDRWVVTNVVKWVRAHQDDYEIPRLLINLSGLSFIDKSFLDFTVKTLSNSGIDTNRIAFEITETAAVDNLDLARNFMNRIKALGCRFALDDFGSGFSTFAYLKNLPIDYLKIDGSLVRHLNTDSVDLEMVRAINEIGHAVGAKTIAEFVENTEITQALKSLGVDYAQGFGLQKPQALDLLINDIESTPRLILNQKAS